MKNKLMLAILPLLALTSCGSNPQAFVPYASHAGGIPTIHMSPSTHTTYLMLSKYGYIEVESVKTYGVDVGEPYFYQNCIKLNLDAGETLPVAKSDVSGATFRGWAFYNEDNENVWPDYYDKVPTADGVALKAIFDGTNAGGGSGGGGGGGTTASSITWTVTDMPAWVTNDGCVIFAWAWQNGVNGAWYSLTYDSVDKTMATFEAPSDLAGMLLARCAAGTTTPNWDETSDVPGKVYNQTKDVNTVSGKTSYSFPQQLWE